MQNINETVKTRYSDDELIEFKNIIEKKLSRAQRELSFYKEQLSQMADNADAKVRGLDDGTGTVINDNIGTLAARQQKYVQHLENALIRIENKVYGVCRESGKLISKDRLKAVPHTTLSMEAKTTRK